MFLFCSCGGRDGDGETTRLRTAPRRDFRFVFGSRLSSPSLGRIDLFLFWGMKGILSCRAFRRPIFSTSERRCTFIMVAELIPRNLAPCFCNSTVVNGNGFLQSDRSSERIPFTLWFGNDTSNSCHAFLQTHLIQTKTTKAIKQMSPFPRKFNIDPLPHNRKFNRPKWFRHEILHASPSINHKPQRWELTRSLS